MVTSAIILAAGNGKRMGADIPKQFLAINGEYILTKTLRVFQESPEIQDIVLVTSGEWLDFCREEIVEKEGFSKVRHVITGGSERYDSVYAGLLACPNADFVFIHDGVRPYVSEEVLRRTAEEVLIAHAVAVGVPSKDTIKIVDGNGFVVETPDRRNVWNVQTPQAFAYSLIRAAYEIVREEGMTGITDDAMVVEASKLCKVKLVMGDYANIKITTPD
ncbi:MAG: 2-C-methyl-D-erythritol 4-phosphate cytidylyltransferase, partial [Lachnospiraceae bacterium]|nr:2-C-methyl-D-erythritol 4-phosphate cytidylyltransferase [Lachnospiraceae bacterium]